MVTSTSRNAYEDCFDLLDQALASPAGIRNGPFDTGGARQLRVRLHYARTLERQDARLIYEPEDPKWNTSPHDSLVIRIKEIDEEYWVYIEPRKVAGKVEELKAAE
jgi:hypothetical protein